MKLLAKITAIFFGLALLGAMVAGAYYLFKQVADLYAKLDVQSGPIVGFASLVLLLSALAFASGMRDARRRTIEKPLVRDKAALYERIIHEWLDAHGRVPEGLDFGDQILDLEKSLALRAGPAVLNAYAVLRKIHESSGFTSPELRPQLAKVLFEMRKDLGLTLKGLEEKEMPLLFLGLHDDRRKSSTKERVVDDNIAVSAYREPEMKEPGLMA